jgi:polar amino acid transport system substrate-binding protein
MASFAVADSGKAQTLEKVRQRGTIIVGVKADYKPFGYRDPSGSIVGFEPDLAKDVAELLGVKLQLEPVVSSNRMQFLQQGKIDLMIATMNDTADRRQAVGIPYPQYYASGVAALAPKSLALKDWEDLKGKKVCGIQGAWYNKPIAEKYGADIIAFKGTAEAQTALLQGNCVAWVYDDTLFFGLLTDTATWGNYASPLPSILEATWGLAVPLPEVDKEYGQFMSGVVYNWHRSGKLLALAKKWDIPASPWAVAEHDKFKIAE